jgi:outer membrane protein assembly factor BamB
MQPASLFDRHCWHPQMKDTSVMPVFRICCPWMIWLFAGCSPQHAPRAADAAARETQSGQSAPRATRDPLPSELVGIDTSVPPSLWTRQQGEDWADFLGPGRDGKSAELGLRTPWPKEGPPVVWQREVGTGYGIGTVKDGRYYHFDRHEIDGRNAGVARLTCIHAETGDALWRFEYPTDYEDFYNYNNGPRCSPVVDESRIYLFGVEGMLHCCRLSDGKPIWRVDTSKEYGVHQNFFGVGSTPVVAGDLLICMIGGSPPGTPGLRESRGEVEGNGTGVVAFDKLTGEVRYSLTDELASYASPVLAEIAGRPWCFVFARGGLVAFDPRTGEVDFHYPWRARMLESVNASTPVVVGNEVLISECYQIGSSLLRVQPNGFEVVWKDERRSRAKSLRTHWNTPIHVDGYIYGCSGRNPRDADLRCVDWRTGEVTWTQRMIQCGRTSLMYVDGHFVCLGEYGTLQLIKANPERCEIVSEVILRDAAGKSLLDYPCWAAPILSHGLLYVRGRNRLVCLEIIPDDRQEP